LGYTDITIFEKENYVGGLRWLWSFFICIYLIKWPFISNTCVWYETYPGMTRNYNFKWRKKLMLNVSATRAFPEFPICSPYNMASIHTRIYIPVHFTFHGTKSKVMERKETVCNIVTHLNFIYSLHKVNIGKGIHFRQSVHISMLCVLNWSANFEDM
jgi:hypothetical protein